MFYTIAANLVFYQHISFTKKYSNYELKLGKYFLTRTKGILPDFIIVINQFIFFFVKSADYSEAISYLEGIRREIKSRKILIIRTAKVLINLLFGLFPDLYIHDIVLETGQYPGDREISIYFLTFKERGIAIGRRGEYIKSANELLKKYVIFENKGNPLEITCKYII
ncbi:MAG: hypothetical protein ACW986_09885 [Promethearchaeota archaeon]|jgi:hypothetical protein